jgi:RNA polymerase sigma factor (sigma-70 family)
MSGRSWHAAGVEQTTLQRARDGDERAFRELTDPYRRELQVHCYRMLGSLTDAEDMVQETLLAAWRGLAEFQERASVRTWLYRIATNRCLNAVRSAGRRIPTEPVRRSSRRSRADAARSPGCSPTQTPYWQRSPTPRPDPKPATRRPRRSSWPSSPGCSACRHVRRLRWCYVTCWASPPTRWPACSAPAARRSRAPCNVLAPLSTAAGPAWPRDPGRRPNRTSRDASPTRTSPPTSPACSRCSPTTPGCPCRRHRTSTTASTRSPGSCAPRSGTAATAG